MYSPFWFISCVCGTFIICSPPFFSLLFSWMTRTVSTRSECLLCIPSKGTWKSAPLIERPAVCRLNNDTSHFDGFRSDPVPSVTDVKFRFWSSGTYKTKWHIAYSSPSVSQCLDSWFCQCQCSPSPSNIATRCAAWHHSYMIGSSSSVIRKQIDCSHDVFCRKAYWYSKHYNLPYNTKVCNMEHFCMFGMHDACLVHHDTDSHQYPIMRSFITNVTARCWYALI